MSVLSNAFIKAKSEGRICLRCGWIVTVANWKKGNKYCSGCLDALKGVNVAYGHCQPAQEPRDATGESL